MSGHDICRQRCSVKMCKNMKRTEKWAKERLDACTKRKLSFNHCWQLGKEQQGLTLQEYILFLGKSGGDMAVMNQEEDIIAHHLSQKMKT